MPAILTASGLGGLAAARFWGMSRPWFTGLAILLLALGFYANVVKRRTRWRVTVFSISAALAVRMILW